MCSFLFICKYELPPVIKMIVGMDPCEESLITNGDFLFFLTVVFIVGPLAAAKEWFSETFKIFCDDFKQLPCNLIFSQLNLSKGYLILGLHFRFCDDVYDFLYCFDCASKFGHHVSFGTRHARRLLAKYASKYFRMLNLD